MMFVYLYLLLFAVVLVFWQTDCPEDEIIESIMVHLHHQP